MHAVETSQVVKCFGNIRAVDDLTFAVAQGEIFGLLGPNGAGKTTMIRLVLDIFKPDQGSIAVFGGPMDESKKDRIGYMPEERGLYQDQALEQVLVYLASLKSIEPVEARRRVARYLERFELGGYGKKKIRELSKGMQQKAQVIATVIHDPQLVIVDEPFSGLDPVNTQVVKDLFRDLRRQGAAIIMSSHQMQTVEELCDRILLIDHGRQVLYGDLNRVRRDFARHAVLVDSPVDLPALAGVERMEAHNHSVKLSLAEGTSPQAVLEELVRRGIPLEKFEVAVPTLDEIFIQAVQGSGSQHG